MLLIKAQLTNKECNLLNLHPGVVKIQLRFDQVGVKLFNKQPVDL